MKKIICLLLLRISQSCTIETLLGKKIQIPVSKFYWQMKPDNQFTCGKFKASHKCKISCMHDRKLSETNFKILQNILPGNALLFRWKKITQTTVHYVLMKNQ